MKKTITYITLLIGITSYAQLDQIETLYSYDNLNRLVQIVSNGESQNFTRSYAYDDIGNRLSIDAEVLGIDDEVLKNTITIYPNPTDQFLNLQLPEGIISSNTKVELYDISGRLIGSPNPIIEGQKMKMHVNGLSDGVYLIRVNNGEEQWSQLFIKK